MVHLLGEAGSRIFPRAMMDGMTCRIRSASIKENGRSSELTARGFRHALHFFSEKQTPASCVESYGSTPLFLPVRPDDPYCSTFCHGILFHYMDSTKETGLRCRKMMYRINNNPGDERVEDGRDALLKNYATPPGILHLE